MSSSLMFYSSPIAAVSTTFNSELRNAVPLFYTPQPQPEKKIQSYQSSLFAAQYSPQTPSPLRTSRNANFMSENKEHTKYTTEAADRPHSFGSSQPFGSDDENLPPLFSTSRHDSGVSEITFTHLPFTELEESKETINNSPFFPSTSSSTSSKYAHRSSTSSAASQLLSHTTQTRTNRKRLFLDRLRQKRDDARFDRSSEQVLRMDWVRERRAWEMDMKRRAELGEQEEETDMMDDFDLEMEEDLSPTEDREIEELLSYLEPHQKQEVHREQNIFGNVNNLIPQRSRSDNNHQRQEDEYFEDDFDDGYDEIFMQVLSQEQNASDFPYGHFDIETSQPDNQDTPSKQETTQNPNQIHHSREQTYQNQKNTKSDIFESEMDMS